MIEGVRSCRCAGSPTSAGRSSTCCAVTDPHFIEFGEIYFTTIYRDVIKGWHRHREMTLNYACISGRIKLVLYDDRDGSPTRGVLMERFLGPDDYSLVVIPPGVWNGMKGMSDDVSLVANCATHPHDPSRTERLDPFGERDPVRLVTARLLGGRARRSVRAASRTCAYGEPGALRDRRGGSARPSERFSTQSRRELRPRSRPPAAERAIEPAPPELRLALGVEVHVARVSSRARRRPPGTRRRGAASALGLDEAEVVGRRVVLLELAVPGAREPARRGDRTRASSTGARRTRTGRSRATSRPPVAQHGCAGAIDLRVAPAAPLVGQRPASPTQAAPARADRGRAAPRCGSARRWPRSCPGRRGTGRSSARRRARPAPGPGARPATMPARLSLASEGWHTWHGDEHLVVGLAGHHGLAVGQVAVGERGVDHDLVLALRHRVEQPVARGRSPSSRRSRRSGTASSPGARAARGGGGAARSSDIRARTGTL